MFGVAFRHGSLSNEEGGDYLMMVLLELTMHITIIFQTKSQTENHNNTRIENKRRG
jgi:hypothetical protein